MVETSILIRNHGRSEAGKTGYYTTSGGFVAGICGKGSLRVKEWRVIEGVAEGLTNAQIAVGLGTTEYVIKNNLRMIYDKLGFSSRVELALWYVKEFPSNCATPITDNQDQLALQFRRLHS